MTDSRKNMRIGFAGLGVMGKPMARRLLQAGHPVAVYDVRSEAVAAMIADDAIAARTAAEAAQGAAVFIGMVVNDMQLRALLFGPDGAAQSLAPGAAVVGMSTMSRDAVIEISTALAARGVDYIDAPVSGGEAGATSGTLSIMAGCPGALFERYKPVLEAMGNRLYHVGERVGDGQAVKMVNQLMVCVQNAVAAEALVFAGKLGLDVSMVFDILTNSAANSWILGNRGPRMVARDFDNVKSALSILIKDMGIVVDAADSLGHPLMLASAAHQLYKSGAAQGLSARDDSAIMMAIEWLSERRA
jgi:L-threonate 2-dehydrogenase